MNEEVDKAKELKFMWLYWTMTDKSALRRCCRCAMAADERRAARLALTTLLEASAAKVRARSASAKRA